MSWGFTEKKDAWPDDDNGEPVSPAYLTHVEGGPLDLEITINLLEAYGIPHIGEYPHNGMVGKIIMGQPISGMDVYVPETMLEDAQNLLNADIVDDGEEDNCESEENND